MRAALPGLLILLGCGAAPAEAPPGAPPASATGDAASELLPGNAVAPPALGDPAPPIRGTTEAGARLDATALAGSYTFVEFIRSGDW